MKKINKNNLIALIMLINFCAFQQNIEAQTCQTYTYTKSIGGTLANSLQNDKYYINADIDVYGSYDFTDAEIAITANAQITIHDGATLTINGSHLFSCAEMWQGIVIETGGKLIIDKGVTHDNSFIEDADRAIYFKQYAYDNANLGGKNALEINNTVFNRNRVSIEFYDSRNVSSHPNNALPILTDILPISIINSIFTCRDIQFTTGTNSWFNYADLKNTAITNATVYPATPTTMSAPYIEETKFSSTSLNAYLKAPYNATKTKSEKAIYCHSFWYYRQGTYKIGDETKGVGTNNATIFDNQTMAIDLLHNDAAINNCTFQNAVGANPNTETYGIHTDNWDENGVYLKTTAPAGTPHNSFFDCKYAINVNFYNQIWLDHNDIRSSKTTTLANVQEGFEGITIKTNGFGWNIWKNAIYVRANDIANIAYGITLRHTDRPWQVHYGHTTNDPMELANIIEVNNNWVWLWPVNKQALLKPDYFVEQGINFEVSAVPMVNAPVIYPPLRCMFNAIRANHNIRASNWQGKDLRIINNYIDLNSYVNFNPNATGIELDGCIPQQSQSNFIYKNFSGNQLNLINYSTPNNANDLNFSNGSDYTIRCNLAYGAVKSVYQFNGIINNSLFYNNYVDPADSHIGIWGLVLNNSIIGQQGTASLGSNNDFNNIFSGNETYWQLYGGKKTMNIFSNATQSPLFVEQGSYRYDPSNVFVNGAWTNYNNSIFGITYDFANGSLQASTSPSFICPTVYSRMAELSADPEIFAKIYNEMLNMTAPDDNEIFINDPQINEIKLKEIIELAKGNTIQKESSEPVLRQYVAQMQLYNFLLSPNGYINKNGYLQEFVNANNNSSFGTINKIAKEIYTGNIATATQLLSNWKMLNRVDKNYAQFLNWLILRKQNKPVDIKEIELLANQCPQTDGNIVFAAQNLYNEITNKHQTFKAACEMLPTETYSRSAKPTQTNNSFEPTTKVYPNPVTNYLRIETIGIKSVQLIDNLGRVVINKNVSNSFTTLATDKLQAGLYLLKIIKTNGSVTTQKIIK